MKIQNDVIKYYDISGDSTLLLPLSTYETIPTMVREFIVKSHDTLFFVDSTTLLYTAKPTGEVYYKFWHLTIDDNNNTITSIFSDVGRIQHIFDNTAFVFYEASYDTYYHVPNTSEFKFYDLIDHTIANTITNVLSSGSKLFVDNLNNILAAYYNDETYHILGYHASDSEIYFCDVSYSDST